MTLTCCRWMSRPSFLARTGVGGEGAGVGGEGAGGGGGGGGKRFLGVGECHHGHSSSFSRCSCSRSQRHAKPLGRGIKGSWRKAQVLLCDVVRLVSNGFLIFISRPSFLPNFTPQDTRSPFLSLEFISQLSVSLFDTFVTLVTYSCFKLQRDLMLDKNAKEMILLSFLPCECTFAFTLRCNLSTFPFQIRELSHYKPVR